MAVIYGVEQNKKKFLKELMTT